MTRVFRGAAAAAGEIILVNVLGDLPPVVDAVLPAAGQPFAGRQRAAAGWPGGRPPAAGAGEASERARASNVSEGVRDQAVIKGFGVGLTEILPIRLGPLAKALDRTDSLSRLKRIFAAGGLEALQEAAANTAQNLIEQGYNPERGTFEGLSLIHI